MTTPVAYKVPKNFDLTALSTEQRHTAALFFYRTIPQEICDWIAGDDSLGPYVDSDVVALAILLAVRDEARDQGDSP